MAGGEDGGASAGFHQQRQTRTFARGFDAGHGLGSTKTQRDAELADELAFLFWQLGSPGYELKAGK